MLSLLKIKIILWYTFLLTIILASTLFVSYTIIGYQLKHEIVRDLKTKTETVDRALRGEERPERDSEESHHEERGEHSERRRDYSIDDLKLYTEIADDNYILFIYFGDELRYLTEKYQSFGSALSPYHIQEKLIDDVLIDDTHFSISALHKPGFTVYIGYELSALTSLQAKLIKIFMVIFPVSILLSVACGFFVTQRTMNVINRITETTDTITSSNLSERIELPKGKDEISELIGTLNSMIDRLEKSFAQAKQFSQDAAHEIRTPLTIIRGEIEELVEREALKDSTVTRLENILEEIQYMSSISERLLLIHNMDTRNIQYHFEAVDLSRLLSEIHQDAIVISSDRKIEITLNVLDDSTVQCNKELLTRLLWNITDNAIKYNKPDGSISIELYENNSSAVIRITDTGIGIPSDDLHNIFDRFYRVDKSRSRELGGSGLGLSICKWIAELHKGVITVDSELDQGSVFTVTIPLA